MAQRRRFWIGTGLVLVVGIPAAFLVRTSLQPQEGSHPHSGGDASLVSELAQLTGPARLAKLKEAAQDSSPRRRLAVAETLADERGPEILAIAQGLLTDNDSEVRLKAVYAIAQDGSEAARPLLRAALRDSDTWVREEVLQWATTNATHRNRTVGAWIIPDLILSLDDSSRPGRAFASSALAKLTGNNWRYSARLSPSAGEAVLQRWKTWWEKKKATIPPGPALPAIAPQRTDPAPRNPLPTLEGQSVTPATSGKLTLVHFWGVENGPSIEEIPDLQKLHERYRADGVEVIGIAFPGATGESGVRTWCQKNGITFPQALAEPGLIAAYGDIHEIPVTLLIDRKGQIRYRWQGIRDYESFPPSSTDS